MEKKLIKKELEKLDEIIKNFWEKLDISDSVNTFLEDYNWILEVNIENKNKFISYLERLLTTKESLLQKKELTKFKIRDEVILSHYSLNTFLYHNLKPIIWTIQAIDYSDNWYWEFKPRYFVAWNWHYENYLVSVK